VSKGIPLFIAEPTGTCRLVLRRFSLGHQGDGHYHDASVVISEDAIVGGPESSREQKALYDGLHRQDPRWPASCGCGAPFAGDNVWQVNEQDWLEGAGHRFTWGIGSFDGPPGAMIRVTGRDLDGRPPAWMIILPNGCMWCTNDRASAGRGREPGPFWEVTGTAPRLTVSPSIDDRDPRRPWHGWIRGGEMVPA
jgi:hypothetical protein